MVGNTEIDLSNLPEIPLQRIFAAKKTPHTAAACVKPALKMTAGKPGSEIKKIAKLEV